MPYNFGNSFHYNYGLYKVILTFLSNVTNCLRFPKCFTNNLKSVLRILILSGLLKKMIFYRQDGAGFRHVGTREDFVLSLSSCQSFNIHCYIRTCNYPLSPFVSEFISFSFVLVTTLRSIHIFILIVCLRKVCF